MLCLVGQRCCSKSCAGLQLPFPGHHPLCPLNPLFRGTYTHQLLCSFRTLVLLPTVDWLLLLLCPCCSFSPQQTDYIPPHFIWREVQVSPPAVVYLFATSPPHQGRLAHLSEGLSPRTSGLSSVSKPVVSCQTVLDQAPGGKHLSFRHAGYFSVGGYNKSALILNMFRSSEVECLH